MHLISKIERLPSSLKVVMLAIVDVLIVILGYYFALMFEGIRFDVLDSPLQNTIIMTCGIYVTLLYVFGVYKKIIKYSGTNDYLTIGGVAIITAALLSLMKPYVVFRILEMNIVVLASLFAGIMSIVFRVLLRTISYAMSAENNANKQKVLIVGAGRATSQVIKTIQMSPANEYSIVGIIDDDPNKINFSMHGIKILGNREIIPEICEEAGVYLILFSINNIKPQEKNRILKICDSTDAKVKIVEPLEKVIAGTNIQDSLRDVEVEDLLRKRACRT